MATPNSSSTDITLAKSGLDFTSALLNASNSSNPLVNGAIEVGQWLGREKLNRFELADCFSKAKGLAFPNDAGQQFCEKVKEGTIQNPLPHLFLVQSGTLGRMIVRDPWLCWIVSTSASLFQFHYETSFISNALCSFIMRKQHSREDLRHDFDLKYRPDRVQVKSVVDKIVSSVWLNVVNAGQRTISLPDDDNIGKVMYTLQQDKQRIILRSQHFLANIALWLILHHSGRLRVVVSGKTVFEKNLGPLEREVEMRVARFCPSEGSCLEDDAVLAYKILEDLSGQIKHLESGTYDQTSELRPTSGIRQQLYHIPKPHPNESRVYKPSIQLLIKCTAQRMMRWLLQVPVVTQIDFATFGFQAIPGQSVKQPGMVISDVLSRIPAIINVMWGDAAKSTVVYAAVEDEVDNNTTSQSADVSMDDFDPGLEKDRALEELLPYFPILQDLLSEIKPSCLCPQCQSQEEHMENLLQPGCLRRIAYKEVMLLIAHAIADGLGCEDVSAIRDTDEIIEATAVVLLELCEGKKVIWDTWFSAAACVYLGCPFRHHIMDIESSGTTYAAIQYGNLSVIASWLDLTKELNTKQSFALITGKGTIGVARSRDDVQGTMQFQGIEETFAIIQTEHTEDTSSYINHFPKEELAQGSTLVLPEDHSSVNCDLLLVPAAENAYRFLFRVRSENHSRVVDPSDAIIRLARTVPSYDCKHKKPGDLRRSKLQQATFIYSFDEALGRWANIEGFYGLNKVGPPMLNVNVDRAMGEEYTKDVIHLSHVLDSFLKVNILLALGVNDALLLNDGSSCLSCVQAQAKSVTLPASQQDLGDDDQVTRTVINLDPALILTPARASGKRKAIDAPSGAQ